MEHLAWLIDGFVIARKASKETQQMTKKVFTVWLNIECCPSFLKRGPQYIAMWGYWTVLLDFINPFIAH